jgi:hypothetical protein
MPKSFSKSFTLLEVILAITVLTLAVGGSFILIQQTLASVSAVQSKLIASYLAQEGIEIVKNIRDNNWLNFQEWDQGLEAGDCWEGDYQTGAPPGYSSFTSCPYPYQYDNLRFLGIDGDGFYGYSYFPGDETVFKRKITISEKEDLDKDPEQDPEEKPDRLKVSVEVLWEERGKTHSITAQEYLYNWTKYE